MDWRLAGVLQMRDEVANRGQPQPSNANMGDLHVEPVASATPLAVRGPAALGAAATALVLGRLAAEASLAPHLLPPLA